MVVRIFLVLLGMLVAATAQAQDKPRYGGELIFLVPSEPPSYDGHREGTFGVVHPLAPHYNTLLRIDPVRQDGHASRCPTWPSPGRSRTDGLVYTFKLRQGVKFHDGSLMTSRDVKATYDKIVFPPAGRRSRSRKGSLPRGRGRRGARSRTRSASGSSGPSPPSSSRSPRPTTGSTRPTSWPRTCAGTRRT